MLVLFQYLYSCSAISNNNYRSIHIQLRTSIVHPSTVFDGNPIGSVEWYWLWMPSSPSPASSWLSPLGMSLILVVSIVSIFARKCLWVPLLFPLFFSFFQDPNILRVCVCAVNLSRAFSVVFVIGWRVFGFWTEGIAIKQHKWQWSDDEYASSSIKLTVVNSNRRTNNQRDRSGS